MFQCKAKSIEICTNALAALWVVDMAGRHRFVCHLCGALFTNRQQLGGHLSKGPVCAPAGVALAASHGTQTTAPAIPPPVPNPNVVPFNINQLLKRPKHAAANHRVEPAAVVRCAIAVDKDNTYKLYQTQDAFEEYCAIIREQYSDDFWRVLCSVYQEKTVTIDRVLQACRKVFVQDRYTRRAFANSVRDLIAKSLAVGGDFLSHVLHEIDVDLSAFELPGNVVNVKFRFLNPLWAWTTAANDMIDSGHEMHFKPKAMFHEQTNERLYGAGVATGEKLKFAASRTPRGGYPGLFGISLDGADTGVSDRNLYPVCVSSLNFDGADPKACAFVGFLPSVPVPDSMKGNVGARFNRRYLDARAHIVQTCIGAVLDEIEDVARDGFIARIGGEMIRLHPFLTAFRVDSKERKTYFGLKSDRACCICRLRKGWSTLRKGTTHSKPHIQRLWRIAVDQPRTRRRTNFGRVQKRSREQLQRHGFSKRRRCTLLDHANVILLRDPQQRRQSLFADVIYNDLLHFELNVCDYTFAALLGVMDKEMKLACDMNARGLPQFRNPDGSTVRRFTQVSNVTYLTTARRLTLTFVWIHCLGTGALMLPQPCRRPALTTLSCLQTIILACHGRRAYSLQEWTLLLVDTSKELFSAIEALMEYKEQHDTSADASAFTPMQR